MTSVDRPVMQKKDYKTDQDVRWCPGCGDYSILNSVQGAFAKLGKQLHETVIISGIGCSSRFPYYMETYGFHTIHGRAPAIATGIKIANPELDVWIVSGDGDALSIGGNHLLHLLRRNIDVQFLLFNNEIYGLTKGQYSPTSKVGTRSPSTPLGSVDSPISATQFALGANARFVARAIDTQQKQMPEVLKRAHAHRGASFVEIFQNCIVFNDGAYDAITDKSVRDEARLLLEHGKPLVFGKNKDKGIRLRGLEPEVVAAGEGAGDLVIHDESAEHSGLAFFLSQFDAPKFPVPLGVFRAVRQPTYEEMNIQLHADAEARKGRGTLAGLFNSGDTWTIE